MAESVRRPTRVPPRTRSLSLAHPLAGLSGVAIERLMPAMILALAVGIGIILRLVAVNSGDGFPLNDGGMFLAMVDDIKGNGFALPEFTSYNGGDIPFAYPPLPFYLAAGLSDLFGWATLDLLIYIPLAFSILTIPAFWLLARSMLQKPLLAGIATLLFVTMPRSYNWEVVGGGLTRSPGFFFATLAVWQSYELFRDGRRGHLAPAIGLSALAVLCHMEMGWFVAFSAAFFAAWHRRDRRVYLNAGLLAAGVAVLTAPWYGPVLLRHGFDPVLSALQAGGHSPALLLSPLFLRFTDDVLFPLALALAILGILAGLRDRRYLMPAWLLLIFLLDPRKAATVGTLPLAMLATLGLAQVVWPLVRRERDGRAPGWALAVAGFLLVIYNPVAALMSPGGNDSPLHHLPQGQRVAMSWVRDNTAPTALFVVMPSANRWANDAPSEWFPALSGRASLNTVQGAEWLGKGTYSRRQEAYRSIADCSGADAACLESWLTSSGAAASHVYVPKGESPAGSTMLSSQALDCCRGLIESLRTAPGYAVVYENDDAVIFERASN